MCDASREKDLESFKGKKFSLQIVGTINAYQALQATRAGHKTIYLSGGGIANTSYGFTRFKYDNDWRCMYWSLRRVTSICDDTP